MILQDWWYTTLLSRQYDPISPLRADLKADVVILGGGMSGVSAAAAFIGKKKKVVLLERNILGGSSTGRSAGFLTPDSELELSQLERRFGIEGAKKIWEVPCQGIKKIVANAQKYDISCDLITQDSLFVGIGPAGRKDTLHEKDSRTKAGMGSVIYQKDELQKYLGSTAYTEAVRYGGTYGISALQYVQGMKKIFRDDGIQVFEGTEARKISDHTVMTHAGSVTADQIIVAIDKMEPSFSHYANEVFHAQTFLSISEPLSDREIKELFPSGQHFQCWDDRLVYSYWRLTGRGRLLLGGGSALTTFMRHSYLNKSVIESVIADFKKKFPALRDLRFIQFWPGLIDTTRDLLPVVVRDPKAPHLHFAFGIVGLPWAAFCGDFLARVVLGEAVMDELRYFEYFSDRRKFLLSPWMEKFLGKPIVFSVNNSWAKYYQKDKRKLLFESADF